MPNSFSDSFASHTDSTSSITIHSTGNTDLTSLYADAITRELTNLGDVFTDLFLDTSARYPEYSYSDHLEQIRPIISHISQEPTVEFSFRNSTDDRIKALEERIEKLEEMIGILLEKRG